MSDERLEYLVQKAWDALSRGLEKTYSDGGVSTAAGLASQLGSPSSEVMMTGGVKRKKLKKSDASGIMTTIDGKKIKLTNLTAKEKDEYLFGRAKIEKALDDLDILIEYLEAMQSPELEDDEGTLEKCSKSASKLIKGKEGVWRRIRGRAVFICSDGTIHAGPKVFIGKKASTLRDQLRAEKKGSK